MSIHPFIRISIVDDNESFRNALKFFISQIDDFKVVGEATNGQEFIDLAETTQMDIALVDIEMPVMDGVQATSKVVEKYYPYIKVIALSLYHDFSSLENMIMAGASGFIQKNNVNNCLEEAIRTVMNNKLYFEKKY